MPSSRANVSVPPQIPHTQSQGRTHLCASLSLSLSSDHIMLRVLSCSLLLLHRAHGTFAKAFDKPVHSLSLSLSLFSLLLYTCFCGISIWSMGHICATNATFMLQVRRSLWWLEQESASLQAYQTSALQERAYMTTSRHGLYLILLFGSFFLEILSLCLHLVSNWHLLVQKYNLPRPTAVFELDYFRKNPKPFYTLGMPSTLLVVLI